MSGARCRKARSFLVSSDAYSAGSAGVIQRGARRGCHSEPSSSFADGTSFRGTIRSTCVSRKQTFTRPL